MGGKIDHDRYHKNISTRDLTCTVRSILPHHGQWYQWYMVVPQLHVRCSHRGNITITSMGVPHVHIGLALHGLLYEVRPTDVFKEQIQSSAMKLLEVLETDLAKHGTSASDFSIYTGATGIALLYWHMGKLLRKPDYHQKALALVEPSVSVTQTKRNRVSFLGGDAGPLALLVVLYHEMGNHTKKNQIIQMLLDLEKVVSDRSDPSIANEVLFGRAGYLYALLFVSKYAAGEGSEKIIDPKIIQKVVNVILQEGQRSGQRHLYYEWHDKYYLGAAHGILGIIQILLMTPESLNEDALGWIQRTLDWILSLRFESGNVPSSLESMSRDRLVHFCHGASGAIYTFFKAYEVFKEDRYLKAALQSADVIWNRGLLRKGYSICHGVGSSAYGLVAAYNSTKDKKYLEQAFLFAHWCFSYGRNCDHVPDRPLSLFEGLAGVVYMLTDFGWNDTPKFPAFIL